MKENYFRFAIGLKEGKVAIKLRFRWLFLTEYIITISCGASGRIRIRVDGKPIYKKTLFKSLRPLVSVHPGYKGGTLLKCTRWLLKLDTHTTMSSFFHFFFFRKVPSNHRLNGSFQGTLKGCASDWVTTNSWIPSFSSTGTSFRPHIHGEKLFRGRGSFSSTGSRPWDMEARRGGERMWRSSWPWYNGEEGDGVQIIFFGPSFGLKITGGQAPPVLSLIR